MGTCSTCGKDFTGGYVKHAIKDHPRKGSQPTPTGVTGGDLEISWGAAGASDQDLASLCESVRPVIVHTPARESRSPVRSAAKAQVKTTKRTQGPRTPVVSARSARTERRNSTPKRERDLQAELRQARRSMRRIERALAEARS